MKTTYKTSYGGIIRLCFVLFICLFAFLLMTQKASAEDAGSPYDIYVGNVPVTEKNRQNILGDGTAYYDDTADTLVLTGYTSKTTSSVGGIYFSVFCNADTDIIIRGSGNSFIDAVYTRSGDIKAENAEITFPGSAFIMLLSRDGNISCTSSDINISEIGALAHHGIEAQNISFASCNIVCTPTRATIYSSESSLFSAKQNLLFDNCSVKTNLPYPLIENIFEGSDVIIRYSKVEVSGANLVVNAPSGTFNLAESDVVVTDTRTFSLTGAVSIYDSNMSIETFFNGIQVAGATNENTVSVIRESKIEVRMLSFDRMRDILLVIYEEMSEADREGQSAAEFVESVRIGSYAQGVKANCSYAFAGTDVTIYKTTLVCNGYRVGIYGAFGASIKISDAVVLKLMTREIAFLSLASSSGAVSLSPRLLSGKCSVVTKTTEGTSLESRCKGVVSFAQGKITISEGQAPETLDEVISLLSGCASSLTIRTAPYIAAWIWIVSLGSVSVIITAVSAFFIFRNPHKAKGTKSKK